METLPAGVQRGFMKHTLNGTSTAVKRYGGLGADLGGTKGRCLFAGSWNADIYPPLKAHVKAEDLHCAKNRMSGMWSPEQPLYKTLQAENKTTLLFTGVNTDQCVLGTLVSAYNDGWNCLLIDDCCGTTTVGGKEVTYHNVGVRSSRPGLVREWLANCYRIPTGLSRIVLVLWRPRPSERPSDKCKTRMMCDYYSNSMSLLCASTENHGQFCMSSLSQISTNLLSRSSAVPFQCKIA